MHAPTLPDRSIGAYDDVTGGERLARLRELADVLGDIHILHLNSTATGGGVAELLRSIIPLCNDLGVESDWLVMDATDDFFEVTKAMHNGLQGSGEPLTDEMKATYREVNERNAAEFGDGNEFDERGESGDGGESDEGGESGDGGESGGAAEFDEAVKFDGGYDLVVIHDPQPLGMLDGLERVMGDVPLIWRCHIDLTEPVEEYLEFVSGYAERVDHAIFSRSAYGKRIEVPASSVIYPSIDPLSEKNRPLDEETLTTQRDHLDPLSFERPVLTQVSRFDPWKDQFGTLEAYRRASEEIPDLQLVLVGGMAGDDPEGLELYERVAREAVDDPDVHVLTDLPDTGVNALQRCSDVVFQKSLREGFGLVVAEALWKETPVVGSNAGGIPLQIEDGRNGYLVEPDDVAGAADRVIDLLENEDRRREFGEYAREHVREQFLLTRQLVELFEVFARVLDREA